MNSIITLIQHLFHSIALCLINHSGDEDVREQLKSMAKILIEMKEDIKRAASDMSAVRADLMIVNQALGNDAL